MQVIPADSVFGKPISLRWGKRGLEPHGEGASTSLPVVHKKSTETQQS